MRLNTPNIHLNPNVDNVGEESRRNKKKVHSEFCFSHGYVTPSDGRKSEHHHKHAIF